MCQGWQQHVLYVYTYDMRIHVLCIHVGSHMHLMCTYAYTCTICICHIYIHIYVSHLICTCIFIYIHMKQLWFVCSTRPSYWTHVFLIGCARHPATACSQLGSIVRLPTLFPTLAALLPALAHLALLVCTHWHVRAPVLCDHGA